MAPARVLDRYREFQDKTAAQHDLLVGRFSPEYGSKGYSMELALEAMKTMQQSGYKVWYGWVSNPVSRFMCQKLGGEELSEVKMTESEVKGGWLVLIKIDLTKELPRLDDLRKSFISPRL